MSFEPYTMNDHVIHVPPGFRDSSVNVLEWKAEDGEKIALVIQRRSLPPAELAGSAREALTRIVERETRDYPAHFKGFLLEHDDLAVNAPFEARREAFRWKQEADGEPRRGHPGGA